MERGKTYSFSIICQPILTGEKWGIDFPTVLNYNLNHKRATNVAHKKEGFDAGV
jgi:hypothetical protein